MLKEFFISTWQRVICILCLLLLTACSSPTCRQWEIQENITDTPKFNSGRLILPPDSDCSHLELEIARNASGTRFYVNLLFLQAPPLIDDPTRTRLEITFDAEDPWEVYPYLFCGGQRLLLPGDVADTLIQALRDGQSFSVKIGRSHLRAIPTNFCEAYMQLLSLCIGVES